jgi:uncharacterized protein (TIGR00255 family)
MLRSMTGFGSATGEVQGTEFAVEVRSVNHRHLMVKTRLLAEDPALDGEVEALVKKQLGRGSVSVSVRVRRGAEAPAASFDLDVARSYHERLSDLAEGVSVAPEVSMDTLLSLPGVVLSGRERDFESPALRKALLAGVGDALTRLVEMRETEGRAIGADLRKHATLIERTVAKIERRMPQVVRGHQRQLTRRVDDLLDGKKSVPPSELAREIAVLADRMDVSEELSRLASHLDQLATMLKKGGRIGRKLDFLVQEFFREVNTIGSKCNDAKVAHWVVDLKTHVERLREQVQNVE